MYLSFQEAGQSFQPYPPYPQSEGVWQHISLALQQSFYRVLSLLISILPGLFALLITLAVMAALGVLVSYVLRRILTAAKFDERLSRNRTGFSTGGIADFSPNNSPTQLAGRMAFWSCALLGLVIGIFALDAFYSSSSVLALSLLPYVTRTVGAILLLFVGNLAANFLARSVLIGAVNNQLQYARFLSMGVRWLVLVLTAAMVLDHLQIGGNIVELAFGILFGGIVLTLSLAIGLGSRDLVSRSLGRERGMQDPISNPRPLDPEPGASTETLRHF